MKLGYLQQGKFLIVLSMVSIIAIFGLVLKTAAQEQTSTDSQKEQIYGAGEAVKQEAQSVADEYSAEKAKERAAEKAAAQTVEKEVVTEKAQEAAPAVEAPAPVEAAAAEAVETKEKSEE